MNLNELLEEYKKLSKEDRLSFKGHAARFEEQSIRSKLRVGMKVWFTEKHGTKVSGIFVRMKTKYAEVESRQSRHGIADYPVIWSVSPTLLNVEEGQ